MSSPKQHLPFFPKSGLIAYYYGLDNWPPPSVPQGASMKEIVQKFAWKRSTDPAPADFAPDAPKVMYNLARGENPPADSCPLRRRGTSGKGQNCSARSTFNTSIRSVVEVAPVWQLFLCKSSLLYEQIVCPFHRDFSNTYRKIKRTPVYQLILPSRIRRHQEHAPRYRNMKVHPLIPLSRIKRHQQL